MCGILAVVGPPGSVAESSLRRALSTLRHRGPDGEGIWLLPDGSAGLGHVRLAVLDPLTSPQPIASEDGLLQLAVNGEFYGHEEIRRRLEGKGHVFQTGGDSEIALHLYEEHGLDFLRHLRGEFSLVLWDGRKGQLIAARDRFGIKPLCYAEHGGGLLLASEAKALFALGLTPAWDEEAFFQVAGMQYQPPDRTLFRGVRQLRPGYHLIAQGGTVRVTPYWDMDYPLERDKLTSDLPELCTLVLAGLEEAVRLRLRADVPVCFHLSGGLDSSAVAALAARHRGGVACFTVGFEAEGYDELALARETARYLGAELHPVIVTQADLVTHLADAVYFSEGLAINGHLPAKFLLARAIHRAGYGVVLSGEGSDEILGGYPHLCLDYFTESGQGDSLERLHSARRVMAGIQLPHGAGLPLSAVQEVLGYAPAFLKAKATLGKRMREILHPEFLARFSALDPFERFLGDFDVGRQLGGRHRVDQSSYLWSKSALANYILRTLGDGTEMAHAVEGRLPFLDHEFFDLAKRIPVCLKIRAGIEKYILRRALEGVLPQGVLERTKHPFTAPPLCSFSGPAQDAFLQDTLRGEGFSALPFFDRNRTLSLLDRLPSLDESERVASDPVLMLALTACLMQERMGL